ncbi:3-deoxy-D-manno-octulosonic acid transferase [Sediminibacterium ginsengisoli]|uniref:3-deoxy-D-manno-octulosonic acid transferase n=1 Tax=Sediminibacterium ginsengisoli TaxID=413434 RepID=UPI00099BBE37|nr:glycosyltransferase N-terminal domain-containing protein [Sediminibacterium ginsengisoli]
MRLIYHIFILLYPRLAWVTGLYNRKARLWYKGRRRVFRTLSSFFHTNHQPVIWMHCASLGEFEQGRPLLEAIRKQYPGYKILLTFFSPSGYEVRKSYEGADHICYLPMDSPANASRFFHIVQPSLVLFVKYEFWHYYLQEAKQRNIPLVLVSGIFRASQPFFKWYGGFHRKMLNAFSFLFVQNNESAGLLQSIGFGKNVQVSGDTRFDRVISIAAGFTPVAAAEHFCKGHRVIVAGSTWTDDDEALDHYANTRTALRFIIAPHDIEPGRLQECLQLYKHAMLYSQYTQYLQQEQPLPEGINTLIVDNIGMLSRLYHYADIAYIGGGFGDSGIHNCLEAAVYGIPVVFGPVYDKFIEADELIDAGGAFSIADAIHLEQQLDILLNDNEVFGKAAAAAGNYVRTHGGATDQIMQVLQENRLLTI